MASILDLTSICRSNRGNKSRPWFGMSVYAGVDGLVVFRCLQNNQISFSAFNLAICS